MKRSNMFISTWLTFRILMIDCAVLESVDEWY